MCVLSMVIDRYNDMWNRYLEPPYVSSPGGTVTLEPPVTRDEVRAIIQEELKDFKDWVERAKKYDTENNEPNCEMEEKKKKVKELADKLGVEIDFL